MIGPLLLGGLLILIAAVIWTAQPFTTWLDRRRAGRAPRHRSDTPLFDALVDEWGAR